MGLYLMPGRFVYECAGAMYFYMNHLSAQEMGEGENPPVGLNYDLPRG